jgi:uncharacterized membrane-anchored protein YjiN (DUF445 family)
LSTDEGQARTLRLQRMRLLATGLLVAMAALYLATGLWGRNLAWIGYVRAFAEGATVGACADWFAVTALFRHPFGLPIPHTGVIPRNRERIGRALGAFVADNFLTIDVLEARLRQLEIGRWGAAWLRQGRNAALMADRIVGLLPELLELASPEDRRRFVGALVGDIARAVPAAPTAAGVLRAVWGGENRAAILDEGLKLVSTALTSNEDLIRAEVDRRAWRWLPKWVDSKIADAILHGLSQTLEQMRDPDHPWRDRLGGWVDDFIDRLETDPALAAKAEEIKRAILSHPALLDRIVELSRELESRLRPATEAEASALADQLAGWLSGLGDWLYRNTEAIEIFNAWARLAVQRTIAPRRRQIGRFIASVVSGWEVESVVEKLELQVGADLQYIRINGTIVGGLAGLVIFTCSGLLGVR